MDKIYYVYAYLRNEENTPYYIGKGKGRRAFQKHKVSVPNDRTKIKFIANNLNENDAFDLEKDLIKLFGRKDLNTGILLNKTYGGEGASGAIIIGKSGSDNPFYGKTHSNKTKEKLSRINSGANNPAYQKPVSEETKRKISKAHKGKPKSEEVRKKISLAKIGKSNGLKGKTFEYIYGAEKAQQLLSNRPKCSEEKKRKISESLKKFNREKSRLNY